MTFLQFWLLPIYLILLYVPFLEAAGPLRNVTLHDNDLMSFSRFSHGWRRVTHYGAYSGEHAFNHHAGGWVEINVPEGVTALYYVGVPNIRGSQYLLCYDCNTGRGVERAVVLTEDGFDSKVLFSIKGIDPSRPHQLRISNGRNAGRGSGRGISLDALILTLRLDYMMGPASGGFLDGNEQLQNSGYEPWMVDDWNDSEEDTTDFENMMPLVWDGTELENGSNSGLFSTGGDLDPFETEDGETISPQSTALITTRSKPAFTPFSTPTSGFQSHFHNSKSKVQNNAVVTTPTIGQASSISPTSTYTVTIGPFTIEIPWPLPTPTGVSVTDIPTSSVAQSSAVSGASTIQSVPTTAAPLTTINQTPSVSSTVPSISSTIQRSSTTELSTVTTPLPTTSNVQTTVLSSTVTTSASTSISFTFPSTLSAPSSSQLPSSSIPATSPSSVRTTSSILSTPTSTQSTKGSLSISSTSTLSSTIETSSSQIPSSSSVVPISSSASTTSSSTTTSSSASLTSSSSSSSSSVSSSTSVSTSTSSSSVTTSSTSSSTVPGSIQSSTSISTASKSSTSRPTLSTSTSTPSDSATGPIITVTSLFASPTNGSEEGSNLGSSRSLSTSLVIMVAVLASLAFFSIFLVVFMLVRNSRQRARRVSTLQRNASVITPFPYQGRAGQSPPPGSTGSPPITRNSYTTTYFGGTVVPRPNEMYSGANPISIIPSPPPPVPPLPTSPPPRPVRSPLRQSTFPYGSPSLWAPRSPETPSEYGDG